MKSLSGFTFVLALLFCFGIRAQEWNEVSLVEFSEAILRLEEGIEEGVSYSMDADYYFFEQLTSQDTTLKMRNSLAYQATSKLMNAEQFGKLVVQDEHIQITVDTAYKQLIINVPNEDFVKRKDFDDFKGFLNSQCKVHKQIKGKETAYSISFAEGARYQGVEIWIGKDGFLTKYIIYAGRPVLDDSNIEDKLIQPRMEVYFSNYQFGNSVDQLNLKHINTFISNINELIPAEKYKDFEIIDLRN